WCLATAAGSSPAVARAPHLIASDPSCGGGPRAGGRCVNTTQVTARHRFATVAAVRAAAPAHMTAGLALNGAGLPLSPGPGTEERRWQQQRTVYLTQHR